MRLKCVVPFCRRTTGRPGFSEWMCGDHWKLLPKAARRVYGRRVKKWRRFRQLHDVKAADRLWAWLKRTAIERAMGIRS